jgi:hypothetical protein
MDPFFALFTLFGHGAAGVEWALGALAFFGVTRAVRRRASYPSRRLPAYPVVKEARKPLPRPSQIDTRRLPASVRLKVAQLRRKIDALLKHSGQFPAGSEMVYVLQRTETDYLPSTLRAYLAIPPGSETLAVNADGKSAWQVLWEQLRLMEHKLDEIAADLHRRNADQLVANGRFLEERFKQLGGSELNLEQGGTDQAPAARPNPSPDPDARRS